MEPQTKVDLLVHYLFRKVRSPLFLFINSTFRSRSLHFFLVALSFTHGELMDHLHLSARIHSHLAWHLVGKFNFYFLLLFFLPFFCSDCVQKRTGRRTTLFSLLISLTSFHCFMFEKHSSFNFFFLFLPFFRDTQN